MSAKYEAFVTVSAKCPVCERETENRYLKSKLYTPLEVEPDHFVKTYRWELPQYDHVRPNHYHLWYCAHCGFCDEKEVFRGEDDAEGKLELLQDALLVESKRPGGVLQILGERIDMRAEFLTWTTALALHILAIYIQELLSPNMRLHGKLARLYLRTAWLYRERRYMKAAGEPDPEGYPELVAALQKITEEWPEAPLDEESAIGSAVEYYKRDLDRAGRSDDIRLEAGIIFLLAALYMKLDDRREALTWVRMIYQQCIKRRASVKKAVDGAARRDDVSSEQIEQLKSLLQWIKNTIDRAGLLADKLTEEIFKEEYPKAREIVLSMKSPTAQDALERLRQEGFYENTCRRVSAMVAKNQLSARETADAPPDAETEDEDEGGLFAWLRSLIFGD